MTEREALLAAICENPDEDTPRLVFADWLDENGEPERAEFIRVQVLVPNAGPRKAPLLKARADKLLALYGKQWLGELPRQSGWVWGDSFTRGFVEELLVTSDMPTPPYDPDPSQAFTAAPIIYLEIMEHTIGPWIPHLRHVRTLTLSAARVTYLEAVALCSSDIGAQPTTISIHGYFQFDEGVVELLQAHFRDVVRVSGE